MKFKILKKAFRFHFCYAIPVKRWIWQRCCFDWENFFRVRTHRVLDLKGIRELFNEFQKTLELIETQ